MRQAQLLHTVTLARARSGASSKGTNVAGYSAILCIGDAADPHRDDAIGSILLQIWVGEGSRQWFEAHYFREDIQPLGSIQIVFPASTDDEWGVLDACLAFYPRFFTSCRSLTAIAAELTGVDRLDFDQGQAELPAAWQQLRREAGALMPELPIYIAGLSRLDFLPNGQIVPLPDEFGEALQAMAPLHPNHLKLLKMHYRAPDRTVTFTRLAAMIPYDGYKGVNVQYGTLATNIGKELGCETLGVSLLMTWFKPGNSSHEHWQATMRPQVAEALEQLGWV